MVAVQVFNLPTRKKKQRKRKLHIKSFSFYTQQFFLLTCFSLLEVNQWEFCIGPPILYFLAIYVLAIFFFKSAFLFRKSYYLLWRSVEGVNSESLFMFFELNKNSRFVVWMVGETPNIEFYLMTLFFRCTIIVQNSNYFILLEQWEFVY